MQELPEKDINGSICMCYLKPYIHTIGYGFDVDEDKTLEQKVRQLSVNLRKSLIINEDDDDTSALTYRDLTLRKCGQSEPLPFSQCYPDALLKNCHKIGEGSYGEVYLYRNPKKGTTVMKIIPIEGDQIVNGDRQKKFVEIFSEVLISTELSNLRNNRENQTSVFSEVQNVKCVQGRYPNRLIDLWDLFDEDKGSQNDSPEIFGENQLYIVLELANGGKDLEAYLFNTAQQAYAIFQQVAYALAVAENQLQFEHRDLHWGNILIAPCAYNKIMKFRIEDEEIKIMTNGVQACIIDFTMSRMWHNGVTFFNDLAQDEDLFHSTGDYQFDVYRLMQKRNGNDWKRFEPYTNILWLHYVLDKMITDVRYKNCQSKKHISFIEELQKLKSVVLQFASAKTFIAAVFN